MEDGFIFDLKRGVLVQGNVHLGYIDKLPPAIWPLIGTFCEILLIDFVPRSTQLPPNWRQHIIKV